MKYAFALSIALLLTVYPAAAGELKLTADIPFAFQVAGQALPSGEYELIEILPNAFYIRALGAHKSVAFLVNKGGHPSYDDVKLVFRVYDGEAFLAEAMANGTVARVLKSKAEKALIARQADARTKTVLARSR